eukprot:756101-Hanusia_phi.AAC.3
MEIVDLRETSWWKYHTLVCYHGGSISPCRHLPRVNCLTRDGDSSRTSERAVRCSATHLRSGMTDVSSRATPLPLPLPHSPCPSFSLSLSLILP